MNITYKDQSLIGVPKTARIQHAIKNGKAQFVDIEVRTKTGNQLNNEFIQVIANNRSKSISFVIKKKHHNDLYDRYDSDSQIIKNIFICGKCHDIFSGTGGNVARHIHQHSNQMMTQKEELIRKIRLFIYQTAQPFSIVENETFRDLYNIKLISVDYLNKLMKQDFQNLLKGIQIEIDKSFYVSLILDEWSSNNNSYLGIAIFLTGSQIENDSIILALSIPNEYDRTAATISKELSTQISNYNFGDKIIGSVTDCAAVMKKAMEITNIKWSPCLCHILHNAIKRMLNEITDFNTAILHGNDIAKDYRFKQYLSIYYKKKQNVQSFNDTRWLSRSKTCHDIVELYSTMRHFEVTINKLISVKNEEYLPKTEKYICPVTEKDYAICVSLHNTLLKLSELILKFQKRSHDNYFYALFWIAKYVKIVKNEMQSNGFGKYFDKFEEYVVAKLRKYPNLASLLAVGALLNPNLEIDKMIEKDNCFYFLIETGKNIIQTNIEPPGSNCSQQDISNEIGKRTKKY